MKNKTLFKWAILFFIMLFLFMGCAKKGIKTFGGDPETLYRQGLALFNRRDYPEAIKRFELLRSSFPDSPPYTVWAELKLGDSHLFKKDYVEAIAAYEEFKKIHPTHEEIPYVQYQIGMAYYKQMVTLDRDQTITQKALSSFEYLIANYPPSLFTEKAKEKIGLCKKRLADHEFYIANYYYVRGNFEAASVRLRGLIEKFPKMPGEDRTLFFLGKSYLGLDQWEKAIDPFSRIVDEYPESSHYKEAKAILDKGSNGKLTSLHKTKTKGSKKKVEKVEAEPDRIVLVKFEEEGRQPIPLSVTNGSVNPTLPKGETKGIVTPLAEESKEERGQIISQEKKGEEKSDVGSKVEFIPDEEPQRAILPQAELATEVKPDEERETVVLLSPRTPSQEEISPDSRPKINPEEEKQIAALPSTSAKPLEKEKSKREGQQEPGQAKIADKNQPDKSQPIDITSDRVETYSKENLIIFKGNVTARQNDIVINADSLEAVIIEGGKGIERVTAGGSVKVQQGLRVANCQKAIFYNIDQKVVMTGDPKVWEGNDIVSGDEIVFDIEQNIVEVKGGPGGQGKANIHPGGESKKLK